MTSGDAKEESRAPSRQVQTNAPSCLPEAPLFIPPTPPCIRSRNGQMLKGIEIAKWHQEERADVINGKIGAKGETASYKCLPSKSSILF